MPAPNQIRVLPEHIANKIAAGEVVERPASVVKELLENAIDAGGSQIDIAVTVGGRKLISVTDNGSGMTRDNALLSIERQATSKIRDVDDIENIHTLGFRGEALAAIASVSRFRLLTCAEQDDTGTEITIASGKMQDVRDAGCPTGTTIEVRDLFFNVPARRKFLRTQQTELSHIRSVFVVQALANHTVGMSLSVDGRDVYRLAGGGEFADRLRDLFGPDYLKELRPVAYADASVSVRGYVSRPGWSRADRDEQYTFVNGRVTSAPLIYYALREGYRTILPKDRHPAVFLFIAMDPKQVDVNVHPTKKEVRFRSPAQVRDGLIAAIRQSLGGDRPAESLPPSSITVPAGPPQSSTQMQIDDLPQTRTFQYPRSPARDADEAPLPFSEKRSPPAAAETAASTKSSGSAPWAWCRVIGLVGSRFVVLETEDGIVLMDPRAAHERVIYERYLAALQRNDVPVQNLLIPETVELQPKDAQRVRQHESLLQAMGFGISEFGGDAFVVDAMPSPLADASAGSLLPEIAHALESSGARGGGDRWREESIAAAACRAAVQARARLKLEEVERLVVDLAQTQMPYTCPNGKPTLIFTSYSELSRKFGRD